MKFSVVVKYCQKTSTDFRRYHFFYHRERKRADTIGTVPVPWAGYSNAKILIYFSNKIYGSNFIKQHSETIMVLNYQNADCSLRKEFIVPFVILFGTVSFPITFVLFSVPCARLKWLTFILSS